MRARKSDRGWVGDKSFTTSRWSKRDHKEMDATARESDNSIPASLPVETNKHAIAQCPRYAAARQDFTRRTGVALCEATYTDIMAINYLPQTTSRQDGTGKGTTWYRYARFLHKLLRSTQATIRYR